MAKNKILPNHKEVNTSSPRFRLYRSDWIVLKDDLFIAIAGLLALFFINKLYEFDLITRNNFLTLVSFILFKAAKRFLTDYTQQLKGGLK